MLLVVAVVFLVLFCVGFVLRLFLWEIRGLLACFLSLWEVVLGVISEDGV